MDERSYTENGQNREREIYERRQAEKQRAKRTLFVFCCILLAVSVFLSFLSASAEKSRSNESSAASSSLQITTLSYAPSTTIPTTTASPVTTPTPNTPAYRQEMTVWIDPGHGWYDNGSYYEFLGDLYEKDINLSISLMLRDYLVEMGFKVEMIRTDDIAEPEDGLTNGIYKDAKRASLVNRHEGDLFVSIHCNKFPEDESIYGTRIYYRKKNNPELTPYFCKSVADKIASMDDSSVRTYDHYDYNVLYTKCPSLLIECGFVTNRGDAAKLTDPLWQSEFAQMIAEGIADFSDSYHEALENLY